MLHIRTQYLGSNLLLVVLPLWHDIHWYIYWLFEATAHHTCHKQMINLRHHVIIWHYQFNSNLINTRYSVIDMKAYRLWGISLRIKVHKVNQLPQSFITPTQHHKIHYTKTWEAPKQLLYDTTHNYVTVGCIFRHGRYFTCSDPGARLHSCETLVYGVALSTFNALWQYIYSDWFHEKWCNSIRL